MAKAQVTAQSVSLASAKRYATRSRIWKKSGASSRRANTKKKSRSSSMPSRRPRTLVGRSATTGADGTKLSERLIRRRPLLYRRSRHIVCYWDELELVYHNYATGNRTRASPILVRILETFSDWQPVDALARAVRDVEKSTRRVLLERLVARSLLERSDRASSSRSEHLDDWRDWNPAAGFFHFTTKDVRYNRGLPRGVGARASQEGARHADAVAGEGLSLAPGRGDAAARQRW